MNLIFQTPWWFIPVCILGGIAFAALLYYKDMRSEIPVKIRWILASFRFLAVTIIALLLLSPLVKTTSRTVEKPVIILAQDDSHSLLLNRDSAYYRNTYPAEIRKLEESLKEDFDVSTYHFSDKVTEGLSTTFSGQETDISALLADLKIRYANRNVGALIIATDGIYNKGNQPVYEAENLSFPIYTLALGDTNIQKDIILSEVNYNKVCYLGNSFPLEVVVKAQKCKNARTTLTVSKNGQTLFTKQLQITEESYLETVALTLQANQSGLQHYRIALSTVEGEISISNNVQDIYVDVLDARQKILILAAAPHPDVSAIRQSLEKNTNYEVEVALQKDFNKSIASYNLVIAHQLPAKGQNAKTLTDATLAKIPVWYILGSQSDINQFNTLNTGLKIVQTQNKADESQAVMNNEFALFTFDEDAASTLTDAPPLSTTYGDYKLTPSMVPLFYQKIGKVSTRKPLLVFSQGTEVRSGILCGEGLWRWRLNNYLQKGNHNAFDELISKTIQYLSIKADKSFFRVEGKNRYASNEAVIFSGEVYNENYEMINDPEVLMNITDQSGKKYEFTFSKTTHAYHLNAGEFPVGDYRYQARVKVGNKVFQENGEFSVAAVMAESLDLVADHNLLNTLAKRHKGEMVYPATMSKLVELLKARDDIAAVSYTRKQFDDVINLLWVLLLIIALLGTEWFLRKRAGAY